MISIAIVFLGAALVSWLLVGGLIRAAPRLGLVDRPTGRSLHCKPTPRGGGIGIALVFLAGWPLALALLAGWPGIDVWWLVLLGFGVAAVNIADDRSPIPAKLRLIMHVAFAAGAVTAVGWFEVLLVPGVGLVSLGITGGALTLAWILGLTNVTNFMDGADGIAEMQCLVAGIAWTAAGYWIGIPSITVAGALIAGACSGFLFHNWSPAQVFMGDVGSAFLGFTLATLPVLAVQELITEGPVAAGRLPVFSVIVMWPFVGDGMFTFVRRLLRRESVLQAHRSHLYQRLVLAGWAHPRVCLLYSAWAVFMAVAAFLDLARAGRGVGPLTAAGFSLLAVWLLVRRVEKEARNGRQ